MMDLTHLNWMLDRIREQQLISAEVERQNAQRLKLIVKLLKEIKSSPRPSTAKTKLLSSLLPTAVSTFAQYAASLLTLGYLLKGGDLMTAVEKLLTLAKLAG